MQGQMCEVLISERTLYTTIYQNIKDEEKSKEYIEIQEMGIMDINTK